LASSAAKRCGSMVTDYIRAADAGARRRNLAADAVNREILSLRERRGPAYKDQVKTPSSMESPSLVVAFCDSPTIRETLAVLLEQECRLSFADAELGVPAHLFADLALVATDAPAPLLNDLTHRWPALPIVAVSVDADVPVRASRQVRTVPLEPHAI